MARFDSEWEKVLKNSQPSHFSDEIMFDVLSRLPVKSITRFKCVCKKWLELFGDSSFVKAHLNLSGEESNCRYLVDDRFFQLGKTGRVGYYLSDEKFEELSELPFETDSSFNYEIVGSIDGLVCMEKIARCDFKISLLLWNPATRESRTIPECPGSIHIARSAKGLGFDLKNSDYKVVVMNSCEKSNRVDVYSLRNDKWRSFEVDEFVYYDIIGTHVNGRLHWLGSFPHGWSIVSFDLSTEKIINMGVPFSLDLDDMWYEAPVILGKSIVVSVGSREEGTEIWLMKKYGDAKSWSKLYNFPSHPIYDNLSLCFSLENGEVILASLGTRRLVSYDPKNQVYKILNFHYNDEIFNYKESLLSVEGGRSFSNRNQHASISDGSTD